MRCVLQFVLAISLAAHSNSDAVKTLSGRLISLSKQCDKYCVDSLLITGDSTKIIVAVSLNSTQQSGLAFGDSVDLNYEEVGERIFVNKITKYPEYDAWYIYNKNTIKCWMVKLSDSIGKVAENEICLAKNTDSKSGRSLGATSYSGSIKGARIKGYSFMPKIVARNSPLILSAEWNIGYENRNKKITTRIQIIDGEPKIDVPSSDGYALEIKPK